MWTITFLVLLMDHYKLSFGDTECSDTSVRLVNGMTEREGRVEVCYNGQWGTVCDDAFGFFDGRVVCRQLGYNDGIVNIFGRAYFGQGSGQIWLDQVNCVSNEENIFNCGSLLGSDGDCQHTEDVGIRCSNSTGNCTNGSFRLVGGTSESEGRLEVCYNGQWGTVCDNSFGTYDGRVFCGQLGYSGGIVEIFDQAYFGKGSGDIWLISCAGSEESVFECSNTIDSSAQCLHSEDVGIRCSNITGNCTEGSIRLVNGVLENEGRLEVCYSGQWGTVCDDSFEDLDAYVACTQLGISSNGTDEIFKNAHFGEGSGEIWLVDLECIGNEDNIFQCNSIISPDNCNHNEDVGIRCNNITVECTTGSIRLVNGTIGREGRLEVCFLGQWGTVCDDHFEYRDARVACRQLGYTLDDALNVSATNFVVGDASTRVWLTGLDCAGIEASIFNCPSTGSIGENSCTHDKDIGIICFDELMFRDNELFPVSIILGPDNIQTSVNISCGIANSSGSIEWVWEYSGSNQLSSGGRYQIITSNSTVTSTLVISDLRSSDSGIYYCSANYQGSTKNSRRTSQLYLRSNLVTTSADVSFTTDSMSVSLTCELTGYFISNSISWIRNGQEIGSIPGKYEIIEFRGNENNSVYSNSGITQSIISSLQIMNLVEGDSGSYECSSGDELLSISLQFTNTTTSTSSPFTTSESSSLSQQTTDKTSVSSSVATSTSSPFTTSESSSLSQQTTDKTSVSSSSFTFLLEESQTISNANLNSTAIAGSVVSVLILVTLVVLTIVALTVLYSIRSRRKRLGPHHGVSAKNAYIHSNFITANKKDELIIDEQMELRDWTPRKSDVLLTSKIEPSNLKLLEKIGQGEFGIVYRGVLTEYQTEETTLHSVAVKTLRGSYSQSQIEEIIEEAHKMKSFHHLNILPLIGISIINNEAPCIVMPFMSNGSLLSYLRKEAPNLIVSELADENVVSDATKQLMSMCLQVAKGMEYLTEQKFVHRDLAARNCMISSDGVIKVADFGLAEDVYTTEYFKQIQDSDKPVKLPIKWMALESIHYGKFSEKTDIWSYGVLCWEVFSLGRSPYPGMDPRGVVRMLDAGERLDTPSNVACTQKSYLLMLSCWEHDPDKRPTFSNVVASVESMMAPLADYMDFTEFYSLKASNENN